MQGDENYAPISAACPTPSSQTRGVFRMVAPSWDYVLPFSQRSLPIGMLSCDCIFTFFAKGMWPFISFHRQPTFALLAGID